MLRGDGLPSACNKLDKRQTVGEVRFPVCKLYEDGFFTPQILKRVEKPPSPQGRCIIISAVPTVSPPSPSARAISMLSRPMTYAFGR